MDVRRPSIRDYSIAAEHDQACAVYHGEHAVLDLNTGVFHPSWRAQENGWALVRARTRLGRWLLRALFTADRETAE